MPPGPRSCRAVGPDSRRGTVGVTPGPRCTGFRWRAICHSPSSARRMEIHSRIARAECHSAGGRGRAAGNSRSLPARRQALGLPHGAAGRIPAELDASGAPSTPGHRAELFAEERHDTAASLRPADELQPPRQMAIPAASLPAEGNGAREPATHPRGGDLAGAWRQTIRSALERSALAGDGGSVPPCSSGGEIRGGEGNEQAQ